MGKTNNDIDVTFLGENYFFPQELEQYVIYCNEFEKINDRLMKILLSTMKKKPMGEGDSAYTDMFKKYEGYLQDEGRKFITMLSKIDVYDVTESEVIFSNKGYVYYKDIKAEMNKGSIQILQNAMHDWMNQQDSIYSSAASNVKGSGYGLISNSFLDHAVFSAMEYSTLKRQAKEADKQYRQSMIELNNRNSSQMYGNYARFYASEIYPKIADAFNMFTSELMTIYLLKLQEQGIYDNNKVSAYSLSKSAEILKNIKLVENKKAVLIEAYKQCPFNPDIYADVMEYGYFDVETMKGAKVFHQESMLIDLIEDKIRHRLGNIEKAREYIEVLAYYQDEDEQDILKKFYASKISKIKNSYHRIYLLCTDSKTLSGWIHENINENLDILSSTSIENIDSKVKAWIKRIANNKEYEKMSSMGLIGIDDIKYKGSVKTTLKEVQEEYIEKVTSLVSDFIVELKKRKIAYEEAYEKYNLEEKKYIDAIAEKEEQLKQQGFFAFSKKKEIKTELVKIQNEYEEYRKTEPVALKDAYLNM